MPKEKLDTGQEEFKTTPGSMNDPGVERMRSRTKALYKALHNTDGAVELDYYGTGKKRKRKKEGR